MKCLTCKHLGSLRDENGEPYPWCEKVCDCPDVDMERECKYYAVASNAGRIRAMTDEELAAFLWSIGQNPNGWNYISGKPIFHSKDGNGWREWLKQEAGEDKT